MLCRPLSSDPLSALVEHTADAMLRLNTLPKAMFRSRSKPKMSSHCLCDVDGDELKAKNSGQRPQAVPNRHCLRSTNDRQRLTAETEVATDRRRTDCPATVVAQHSQA